MRGSARRKKRDFFCSKFFKKCPKTGAEIWQNSALGELEKAAQKFGKTVLWESSKNQFGRPKKKKIVKILENFLKIRPPPPPRENPRSAPGFYDLKTGCNSNRARQFLFYKLDRKILSFCDAFLIKWMTANLMHAPGMNFSRKKRPSF